MNDTTLDAFLGGRIRIRQPVRGYRAGADPVLLAASVPARRGDSVLELGTGCGVALLCLLSRVPGAHAVGVERNPEMAALARRNAEANGMQVRIVQSDLADLPEDLRAMSFDHVMANPPFFDRDKGNAAHPGSREDGRGEDTPVALWIDTAIRRLRSSGSLSLIQRVDRLPEVLSHLDQRVGSITVLPLAARPGRQAKMFLLRATKGAKAPFRLLGPFVIHSGDTHIADGDDHSPEAAAILRSGAPLDLREFTNR